MSPVREWRQRANEMVMVIFIFRG